MPVFIAPTRTVAFNVDIKKTVRAIESCRRFSADFTCRDDLCEGGSFFDEIVVRCSVDCIPIDIVQSPLFASFKDKQKDENTVISLTTYQGTIDNMIWKHIRSRNLQTAPCLPGLESGKVSPQCAILGRWCRSIGIT